MSEERIRSNRIRRQQELRRHIVRFIITTCLVVILAVCTGSFFSKATESSDENAEYKYYTSIIVKAGDSMTTIADKYISAQYGSTDDYISEVAAINHLSDNEIHAGEHIIVPYYTAEFVQ